MVRPSGVFCFSGKARKGALREIFLFQKISLRDDIGTFRFSKSKERDVFSVTFCSVQKVTKNTPRVATLWTPGDGSKLYKGMLLVVIEAVRV